MDFAGAVQNMIINYITLLDLCSLGELCEGNTYFVIRSFHLHKHMCWLTV